MNEDQLNALMCWVDAKIKSTIESDCLAASLFELELREELKNIMMSETTYIGETQWMQVPEPLSNEEICKILLKKEWKGFFELVRMIEKAHGIGVDDER